MDPVAIIQTFRIDFSGKPDLGSKSTLKKKVPSNTRIWIRNSARKPCNDDAGDDVADAKDEDKDVDRPPQPGNVLVRLVKGTGQKIR